MTTSTFFSETGDGFLTSYDVGYDPTYNADYSQTRAGTGDGLLSNTTDTSFVVGQEYLYVDFDYNEYLCYEGFIAFITSAIADGDTIDSATLSLWLLNDDSTSADFILRARVQAWGALTTADWDTGYSGTLVATKNTSGIGATGAYKDFTSEAAFVSNVSKTGTTELIVLSSNQEANTAPYADGFSAQERVTFASANDTTGGGTDHDPKLVVVHSGGSTNASVIPDTVVAAANVVDGAASAEVMLVGPSPVAAAAAVPAPTASAGVSITPTTVAVAAAVPTPAFESSAAITPTTVDAAVSVPAPVVSAIANVSITPDTVAALVAVPTPSFVSDVAITPTTVDGLVSVETPVVTVTTSITPTTVGALASVPAPTVEMSAAITPMTVDSAAAVPTPVVTVGGADASVSFLDPPLNLTATTISDDQIDLSWDAVAGATIYAIMRDGVVIVTDNPDTTYSDTGLDPSTTYTYRVKGRP